MKQHSVNGQAVAEFLAKQKGIVSVKYPGLKSDPDYARCQKYLGGLGSGVVTFDMGSRERAVKFMNSLKLAAIVVHVADARTGVLHPASSTHRQLSDAQLAAAGIKPGTIRFSCGIEATEDIIEDIAQALDK
jgi:O-acetylhomoserine (thiol)-lyase